MRKRELTGGTLAAVLPLHSSNILFLLGGGRSPLYPPNKVIIWNDAIGKDVAELEFREKVRGMACRRGWLAVSLRRRVVVFQIGKSVTRYGEWDTYDNPRGMLAMATAPYSTLLATAGRQTGHVQLIHLPPCPIAVLRDPPPSSPPRKAPPPLSKQAVYIIAAHDSALTTLCIPPSGRLLATTSVRGTLVRIWDPLTGQLVKEFRRGSDKADIYGVAFRPDERELCVWSDKGTVHVFDLMSNSTNRQSALSPLKSLLPFPKYFESEWSYAQYRIPVQSSHISLSSTSRASSSSTVDQPEEERCVVGWISVSSDDSLQTPSTQEYQLIALTFSGGWYRLSLPKVTSKAASGLYASSGSLSGSPPKSSQTSYARSATGSSSTVRLDKGKEKERDKEKKESRSCTLQEYRRFGRWDGW